ncbi:MAG: glycosyltransferase [Thermoanaerobaculia bacterium]
MNVLAAVSAAAAVLSVVCLVLNLRSFRRLGPRASPAGGWPPVSIVIPARNEERNIAKAVAFHLACDYPDFEVVVVDDHSTDATPRILDRMAARSPRLRVILAGERPPGWLGKPNALRCGVAAARGRRLLIVDADVEYAPAVLRDAVAAAAAEDLGLLCLLPRMVTVGFWEGVIMPNLAALLYLGPGFLFNSARFQSLAIGGGSGNLVSREALERSGGFETLRNCVIDDVALARQVKRAGFRAKAVTACDGVRVRMYEGFRETVDGFTKNVAYLFRSPVAVLVFVILFASLAWAPYAVVLSGAGRPAKILAGGSLALILAGRLVVARVSRTPAWSSLFHVLMVSVWAGIAARSVWRRSISGNVVWRGRSTPAGEAR